MRAVLGLGLALLLAPGAAMAESVSLAIGFSPAARDKLQSLGEHVVINAMYYGEPSDAGQPHMDEIGQVQLGSEVLTIWPRDQVVTLGGALAGLPRELVQAPYLNVNVYSARFADEDNLLDCGLVDGPLSDLTKAPQAMTCKLIGE